MFNTNRDEGKTTALTAQEWTKYIAGKKGAYTVVYRNPRDGGYEVEWPTAFYGFGSFRDGVDSGHFAPGSGRRLAVRGPDFSVIDDIHDPLPNRNELIEWAAALFPGFPWLVYPRPSTDPVLDDPPPVPGWLPPLGDVV